MMTVCVSVCPSIGNAFKKTMWNGWCERFSYLLALICLSKHFSVYSFHSFIHSFIHSFTLFPRDASTSNGGCHREEKNHEHWSLITKLLSSVPVFFFLLDQIKSNCMYWLHWKSKKNRTEPNELDELKYSKSPDIQSCLLKCFLVFACLIKTYSSYLNSENQINFNELKYLKTSSQMTSSAHWHTFLHLLAWTCIKIFIHLLHLQKKDWAKWAKMLKNTLTDEQPCL